MTGSDVPPVMDPEGLLGLLASHGIDYVLIGAFAALLHGSPLPTQDLDICPARDDDNIARLASMLLVKAQARWETTGLPFASTQAEAEERLASGSIFSFETRYGRLDLIFEPAGTRGFKDLVKNVIPMKVGTLQVPTSSLEDIIRSKQAANRARDQQQLPTLRKLLERLKATPE